MLDYDPISDGLQVWRDSRVVSSFDEVIETRLKFFDDSSGDIRGGSTDTTLEGHALFIATGGCNGNGFRPQFGDAGVLSGRVLEAQTLHERPEHLLCGGINEVGSREGRCWPLTRTKSLVRSRISSFSHQVFITWAKPSEMLLQTKSVASRRQYRKTPTTMKCVHSFSPLKPSIRVNILLVSENPASASATLSITSPMRSFKLKMESGLAASAEILAVISGL